MRRTLIICLLLLTMVILWAKADNEVDYTDPAELNSLIEGQDREYILIDVRTKAEYDSGYIPTAINIPYNILADNLPTEDKDARIIVYCRSGSRSNIALNMLLDLGFKNVVDFGGISRWTYELMRPEQPAEPN